MVKLLKAAILFAALLWGQWAFGGEVVMLDFASPTCGPCHQMKPTVHNLKQAGYPIREVDVTSDPATAAQFGVDRVPCFVMLVDGQEVERVLGATSSERLQGMFRRAQERQSQSQDDRIRAQSPDPAHKGIFWSGVTSAEAAGAEPETCAVPTAPAAPAAEGVKAVDLLSCSVRIIVDEPNGHSYGTGTIIDARSGEALIITCGHLFRDSKGKGTVWIELLEQTAVGDRVVGRLPAQVISYDLDRDLGLLSIRLDRPVRVAPVAPPQTVVSRGDRVQTVGCDNGKEPTVQPTRVTAIDRYQGPPNIEVDGAPVEGRSGGGLFNGAGQLIGVCFAADYEGNEGLFAGLEAIHDELNKIGLREIYDATGAAAGAVAAAPAAGPIVRGQDAMMPLVAAAAQDITPVSATVAQPPAQQPANLDPMEQAAWEEITGRASESEVICIIRPKDPGGKSEVITLNGVSPEFVRALAGRQQPEPGSVVR